MSVTEHLNKKFLVYVYSRDGGIFIGKKLEARWYRGNSRLVQPKSLKNKNVVAAS